MIMYDVSSIIRFHYVCNVYKDYIISFEW